MQARPLGLPEQWVMTNLAEVLRSEFSRAYVNSLMLCTASVAIAVAGGAGGIAFSSCAFAQYVLFCCFWSA